VCSASLCHLLSLVNCTNLIFSGMIRINFQPYTTAQLEKIVQARLASAKDGMDAKDMQDVVTADAIKFAAMKVSSISGDARRVLDICRSILQNHVITL
jgi:origin recognition complex subunit 1